MYSYDRRHARLVTANMSLVDFYGREWRKVLETKLKAERAASMRTLKEVKAMLSNLGLDLDLSRSGIDSYRVGSDSWGHSAFFTLKDTMNRGAVLTADVVADSVWDATQLQPKASDVKNGGPGIWTVQAHWGG